MRRLVFVFAAVVVFAVVLPNAAQAASQMSVDASLAEPTVNPGCDITGLCGGGVMKPFGRADETIVFGAGCAGACDRRTISVAGGSLFLDERAAVPESQFLCPGPPGPCRPSQGVVFKPFIAPLLDVVAGGTGVFAGATGVLSGTLFGAGPADGGSACGAGGSCSALQGGTATIHLSGTLVLAA
jgi:hypothetical protein